MKYEIIITEAAQKDFENIYFYISQSLCNKQAAERLISAFDKKINTLSDMPESYPIVGDHYLKKLGIRFIPVKNYIIFYTIDYKQKNVFIIRILYGRRNWNKILNNEL